MRDPAKDEGTRWGWGDGGVGKKRAAGTEREGLLGNSAPCMKSRSLNEKGHVVHVVNIKQTDHMTG